MGAALGCTLGRHPKPPPGLPNHPLPPACSHLPLVIICSPTLKLLAYLRSAGPGPGPRVCGRAGGGGGGGGEAVPGPGPGPGPRVCGPTGGGSARPRAWATRVRAGGGVGRRCRAQGLGRTHAGQRGEAVPGPGPGPRVCVLLHTHAYTLSPQGQRAGLCAAETLVPGTEEGPQPRAHTHPNPGQGLEGPTVAEGCGGRAVTDWEGTQ